MFIIPKSELNLFPANRFIVQSMAEQKFRGFENKERTYNISIFFTAVVDRQVTLYLRLLLMFRVLGGTYCLPP